VAYTLSSRQDVEVQLSAINGEQRFNKTLFNQATGKHQMPLTMPDQPGVYILTVRAGDARYEREIVIMP
jgi:hypothetical protein